MEIIALIISVVSFVAVIYQNLNLKSTLNNQVYKSFVDNAMEMDKIFIEHPEMRKYLAVIDFCLKRLKVSKCTKKYLPKERREGWIKFVNDVKNTPAYSFYMARYSDWFMN